MVLNWLHQGDVVDGSTFRPPKSLGMLAENVADPPEHFRVYRVFGPVSEVLRRLLRQPVQRLIVSIPTERGRRGTYSAIREWMLPTPTGYHFASQFMFKGADPHEESGRICSHRLGDIGFRGAAGATVNDPTGSVPIGTNGNGALSVDFRASVDPILIVEVLTGVELLHAVVRDTLEDLDAEGVDTQARDFQALLSQAFNVLLPAFTYPQDWYHGVSPEKFTAEEESVNQIDVRINAGSAGEGLIALQVIDGDNPEVGAISELITVSVSGDGRLSAAKSNNIPRFIRWGRA
jgi:hypothetical protein